MEPKPLTSTATATNEIFRMLRGDPRAEWSEL